MFPKGKSGNPGGRPKECARVMVIAREKTEEAITRLVYWMQSDNPKASVSAAVALLNRGWGMPVQGIQAMDKDGAPTDLKVEVTLVKGIADQG